MLSKQLGSGCIWLLAASYLVEMLSYYWLQSHRTNQGNYASNLTVAKQNLLTWCCDTPCVCQTSISHDYCCHFNKLAPNFLSSTICYDYATRQLHNYVAIWLSHSIAITMSRITLTKWIGTNLYLCSLASYRLPITRIIYRIINL